MTRVCRSYYESMFQGLLTTGNPGRSIEWLSGKSAVAKHVQAAIPRAGQIHFKLDFRQNLSGHSTMFRHIACRSHEGRGTYRKFVASQTHQRLAGELFGGGHRRVFGERIPVSQLRAILRRNGPGCERTKNQGKYACADPLGCFNELPGHDHPPSNNSQQEFSI